MRRVDIGDRMMYGVLCFLLGGGVVGFYGWCAWFISNAISTGNNLMAVAMTVAMALITMFLAGLALAMSED